nr:MAG TPA: hypothetical protein [Caudoviricetes sp.]
MISFRPSSNTFSILTFSFYKNINFLFVVPLPIFFCKIFICFFVIFKFYKSRRIFDSISLHSVTIFEIFTHFAFSKITFKSKNYSCKSSTPCNSILSVDFFCFCKFFTSFQSRNPYFFLQCKIFSFCFSNVKII